MKVISIRQPWASLIVNGHKEYEFRNWRTNFRGECLIHASKNIEKDVINEFKHLNLEYPIGKIIGSVNIRDCIKVNRSFEKELITKNNLVYGKTHDRVGYAFELKDIKKFRKPIEVKGELGFWNYYKENEIMEKMKDIKYGYVDKNNNKHNTINSSFSDNYILQSHNEILKNRVGICWDQVELERYYFKNWNNIKTFFICHYDNDKCPTHTFLTFKKNDKYYWFEHSWERFRGIHEYNSLKEMLLDVKDKFIKYELNNKCIPLNLYLYEYKKPKYYITVQEFYKHCENGKQINCDIL